MSIRGRSEDISTLLYMVPFVAAIVYGLVVWVETGISLVLPSSVYLTVTRDPILFVVAALSVMLGIVVEANSADPSSRRAKLAALGSTLQSIAVASLVLVLFFAWYANGFTDLSGTATDFIVGKYGLVFPAMLVLLSYLLSAQFRLTALGSRRVLAVIALLLVPASLYELGRHYGAIGLGTALLLLIVGVSLFLLPLKKAATEDKQ